MAHLSNEVSKKIRSAIKAKLVELGAYVDEELPDYIMVMVLNKKSKETLNQDLKLFLNKNTETFVDWLLNVLAKLEEVVVSTEKKRKEKKKRRRSPSRSRRKSSSERVSSTEPRLKSKVVAALPPPPDDSDGEYDPEKILKKSILASSIKVPERKRGVEANKKLVLKAVAEADQSIKKRKAQDRLRDSVGIESPVDVETKDVFPECDLRERLTKKRQQRKEEEKEKRRVRRRSSSLSDQEEDLEKMRELVLESIKRKNSQVQESRKIVVTEDQRRTETSLSPLPNAPSPSSSSSEELKQEPTKTKFIVTLEGINSRYFKNKKESEESGRITVSESLRPKAEAKKRPIAEDKEIQKKKNNSPIVSLESSRDARDKKKPEAKVAPMQPVSTPEKPKRKRITPPEPSPQLQLSPYPANPPTQQLQTFSNIPICKYWPNCSRGIHCFYKHPDKLTSTFGSATVNNKYSWTAASLPP